jgi:hypothetical protein
MSQPEDKLVVWIRRQLSADVEEDGLVCRFELWHSSGESGGSRIATLKLDGSGDADDIAAELWDAANRDADTRISSLPNRYVVASFRRDNDRDTSGQYPFILKGGGQLSKVMNLGDTFAPNDAGERAHLMHQTGRMHELMFGMSQFMAQTGQTDLERERRLRMRLEERQLEVFSKLEELSDRKHERDLSMAREEAKAKRHEQLMAMLMTFAPVAMATFANGMGFSGTGAVRDFGVGQILKGLSENEVMGMLAALEPSNQAKFLELYQTYAEKEQKEQGEKHPLLRDVPKKE